MIRNSRLIFVAALLGLAALVVYLETRTPAGVTPMGDGAAHGETIAWISLAIAVLSLLTALIGLLQKLLEISSR